MNGSLLPTQEVGDMEPLPVDANIEVVDQPYIESQNVEQLVEERNSYDDQLTEEDIAPNAQPTPISENFLKIQH